MEPDPVSPIAIIGVGGRFPGTATSPEDLWDMIAQGRDAWSKIPESRFNHQAFYHPDAGRNGAVCFVSSSKYLACSIGKKPIHTKHQS